MKKIFIGTTEICGMVKLLSFYFRKIGFEVTSIVRQANEDTQKDYTYVGEVTFPLAKRMIKEHDYFIFIYGQSLLPENIDFKIIQALNKKIVSILVGNDVRHTPAWETQNNYTWEQLSSNPRPYYCSNLYTNVLMQRLRMAELYSCGIYSQPNVVNMGIRPYKHLYMPLEKTKFTEFKPKNRSVPLVIHAPSDTDIKGTYRLLQAFKNIESRGIKFELKILHGLKNYEVLKILSEADCAVDQLFPSEGGLFSREAMASGCAVASVLDCYTESERGGLPIFPLHLSALEEDLSYFLQNINLRMHLAKEGYQYVNKFHDPIEICKNILKTFLLGGKEKQDFFPHYFRTEFQLDKSVVLTYQNKDLTTKVLQKTDGVSRAEILNLAHKGLCSFPF